MPTYADVCWRMTNKKQRYLPLLPPALLGFLEAPVPYVAGVLAAPPQGYALEEGVVVLVVEEDVVLGGEQLPRVRCSVYLRALLVLYWYKSTNTDASFKVQGA